MSKPSTCPEYQNRYARDHRAALRDAERAAPPEDLRGTSAAAQNRLSLLNR